MKKLIFIVFTLIIFFSLITCNNAPRKGADNTASARETTSNDPKRITINKNEFAVSGKRIWINGANTPWNSWNDFGGNYNNQWWDDHFYELRLSGINSTRVWINCNNDNGAITLDNNGMVTDVSKKHWEDLDKFFEVARKHEIYIMATLLSFDHFKSWEKIKWQRMLKSKEAAQSFAENYTIPFVKRYGNNPYLWSVDLCNEPDWIHEDKDCGNIAWNHMTYFFAVNAAAVHENSEVLVTVGMGFPKYNADGAAYEGNKVSDASLQRQYNNPNAFLDFWSPHYYDWVGKWYGVPFYISPYGQFPGGYGMNNSKPAVIGECAAKGSAGDTPGTKDNTILTDYLKAFENGWQGVMAWTSNGVDQCGDIADMEVATMYMEKNYKELIYPLGKK